MDRPILESTATHAGLRSHAHSPQRRAVDTLHLKASSASLRSPTRGTSPVKSLPLKHGHVRQRPSTSSLAARSPSPTKATSMLADRDSSRTSQAFLRSSIPPLTKTTSTSSRGAELDPISQDKEEPAKQSARSITQMNDEIERLIRAGRQALGTKIDVFDPGDGHTDTQSQLSKTASREELN